MTSRNIVNSSAVDNRFLVHQYNELLYRYKRLEQISRNMYDWCDGVANRYYTIVPETVKGFRKQLDYLGVDVNKNIY